MIELLASDKRLDCISSRPSLSGCSDGYTLEDEEFVFYKKINHKRNECVLDTSNCLICLLSYRNEFVYD